MANATVNITPTPRILNVLAHTTMEPVDALCELIDNAIDAFRHAEAEGITVDDPTVRIEVPSVREINHRDGRIRVADNGPGMTLTQIQHALCAGYSSNNAFDNLGLFGVGFNISTSKFGIRTRVATMRPGNSSYLCVKVDLQEINRNKCFDVPYEEIQQTGLDEFFPRAGMSGTVVEVSHWWPDGDTNHAFALNLARLPDSQLRKTLGRRYSTLLLSKSVKIILNGQECRPFRHCAWCADRFVTRQGVNVPAVMKIDSIVGTVRKCEQCGAEVGEAHECPECHSHVIREITQRVWGWIGIQRYEDKAKYGIDLIRNGRCIREAEKTAFFFFKNEDGILEKEYPQDNGGTNGRIIGEIHMDFVPVGFTKEDFDRSSIEWHNAVKCIRGETSLLPSRIPQEMSNTSPMYKLFQAYRRSDPGPTCLYMGIYDVTKGGPVRISREVIDDYKQKFENNEPGYGWDDDSEWYKHVEDCMRPPEPEAFRCSSCQADIPPGVEECPVCGAIILAKKCVNCGIDIPLSAKQCPHCGADQGEQREQPDDGGRHGISFGGKDGIDQAAFWFCEVCHSRNPVTDNVCSGCGCPRGTLDPVGEEYLRKHSDKRDDLSHQNFTLILPNGDRAPKISFNVFFTRGRIEPFDERGKKLPPVPFVEFRSTDVVSIFIDPQHRLFASGATVIKEMVAEEVAQHILEYSLKEQQQNDINIRLAILVDIIKRACWREDFEIDRRGVNEKIAQIFKAIKEQLVENTTVQDDYFSMLESDEKSETLRALAATGVPAERYSAVCAGGEFLRYAPDGFIFRLFQDSPDDFFDKGVFKPSVPEDTIRLFGKEAAAELHQLNVQQIIGHLQTVLTFIGMKQVFNMEGDYLALVRLSANALIKKMAVHV